jgi:hypothetical protein
MVKKFLPYLFPLIAAILLVVLESDVLYALQEQNLFLHTPLFFEQQMVKAGGLLTWVGCYLTQFFYYPMLGAGILCLLWAFFMWLCKRAFRLENLWLTLIPTASLLLTIVTLGYWVYYLKLPGHAFCATIGSIVTVALAWGYRALPHRYRLPSVYIVFAAGLGYMAFGFYALLATALMGLISWCDKKRWDDCFLAVTQIILWPVFSYYYGYHETNIVNIFWVALPVFAHQGERFFAYNLPYIVLFASMALMVVKPTIKSAKWINISIVVVTVIALSLFWNRDENLHRELSMTRNIEKGQWAEVLQTAKDVKGEPTRLICMMRNLALFNQGQPFSKAYDYPEGAKRPAAPFVVHTVHTAGKLLYLQYGIPNYCYRWCMEDGVEYGWTVERLKLMAMCSILNNEPVAAQRFVNLLKKTDFHKSWAKHMETFIQDPRLVVRAPEFRHILPLLRDDNFLTADQSQQEMFLIEQILSTEGATQEQRRLAEFTMGYYRNNHKNLIEQ